MSKAPILELGPVRVRIGLAAVPTLAAYLADRLNGEFPRISAADGLYQIAKQHPEARDNVVKAIGEQIARCEEGVYDLNGFVVSHLVDLKAIEVLSEQWGGA